MKEFFVYHRNIIMKSAILIGILLGIYIFFAYIFVYVAPFILAWFLATAIEPIVQILHKKTKIPRGLSAFICIILTLFLIGSVGSTVVTRIIRQAQDLYQSIPAQEQHFLQVIERWEIKIADFYFELPKQAQLALRDHLAQLADHLPTLVGVGVRKGSVHVVGAIPSVLIFVIATLIATFFFSKDRYLIHQFIYKQIPIRWMERLCVIRTDILAAVMGYIKAQLILMCIVAVICIVGLAILQYPYALFVGVSIAAFDALPIFGSGAILLPWAIWSIFIGEIPYAVGIVAMYGTVIITRQLLEPKILGEQIGVYPLVTLMSIYIGLKVFGVFGIIIGPIFIILIKTLQKLDMIPSWKR
jgi:sporulation integral membrane protein YtvI